MVYIGKGRSSEKCAEQGLGELRVWREDREGLRFWDVDWIHHAEAAYSTFLRHFV